MHGVFNALVNERREAAFQRALTTTFCQSLYKEKIIISS